LDKDIEIAIAALEQGIADRQRIIAGLRDLEVSHRKGPSPKTTAGKTPAAKAPVQEHRKWTPERKKKYLATLARKKKEAAASAAAAAKGKGA
jgi:hypothetical protein